MYLQSLSSDTYIDEMPLNRAIKAASEAIRDERGKAMDEILKSVLRGVLQREPDEDDFRDCVFYTNDNRTAFTYSGVTLGTIEMTNSRPCEAVTKLTIVFTPVEEFTETKKPIN